MSASTEILLIAIVTAVACAIPGVFLVLRQMAMMSDAISHTVLLGIVLGFFAFQSLDSPWLIPAAALMGVITVFLVEMFVNTRLVKEDAAIGIVFPALFSIAVILISRYASGVHLDSDAVLLGQLEFAFFDRSQLFGLDIAHALKVMGIILILNVILLVLFYKELKISTFDAGLAAALGFPPVLIHYGLMMMVSITAVGAFDAVGSILVVALMIAPAATGWLFTDRLDRMLIYAVVAAVLSAVGGFAMAIWFDTNMGGSMATMCGVVFIIALLAAPDRGLIAVALRRMRQRWEFSQTMLAIHLLNHEGTDAEEDECRVDHLWEHLRWQPDFAEQVIRYAEGHGVVRRQRGILNLTDEGRAIAEKAMVR